MVGANRCFSMRVDPLARSVVDAVSSSAISLDCDTTPALMALSKHSSTRRTSVLLRRLPRLGIARVRGRSMTPTLQEGDRLLVRYDAAPLPGAIAIVRFA